MPKISHSHFGEVDGTPIHAYELTAGETRLQVITLGAIVTKLSRPDREGNSADIVLGYDHPASYLNNRGNAGAICGRYANRISNARFELDGRLHVLAANDGSNHLHGGPQGFGRRLWTAVPDAECNAIHMHLESEDGDQGYPGRLLASVTYALLPDGALSISMRATTDSPSVANLVYHGYWNLAGHQGGAVLDQVLRVEADDYLPVDTSKIPMGWRSSVKRTPFDFRNGKPIGRDVAAACPDGGYDHNFCLRSFDGTLRPCAFAYDPCSGRALEIHSNQPGLQLYTANHFGEYPAIGKGGVRYGKYAGFALETQAFPNAPNEAAFPSARLDPAAEYRHEMLVRFSTVTT